MYRELYAPHHSLAYRVATLVVSITTRAPRVPILYSAPKTNWARVTLGASGVASLVHVSERCVPGVRCTHCINTRRTHGASRVKPQCYVFSAAANGTRWQPPTQMGEADPASLTDWRRRKRSEACSGRKNACRIQCETRRTWNHRIVWE